MLKRHEIKVLLKAGHSRAEVAKLAGISVRSVKRIVKEADIAHVDDAAERRKRAIGRPSVVQDFRKLVAEVLEEKPDLMSVEVLRRARLKGYKGGKTAFYAVPVVRRSQSESVVTHPDGQALWFGGGRACHAGDELCGAQRGDQDSSENAHRLPGDAGRRQGLRRS